MTSSPSSPHPRLRGRLFAATAIVVSSFAAFGADGGAGAAPKTSSAAIATEADRALAALDAWQADRNPADYVRFVQGRDATATMTAVDLEVDEATLRSEWSSVPMAQQQAVLAAMSQLGVPYQYLAAEPGVGFDCSGLTLWAYDRAGIEMPRVSSDQIDAAADVEFDDAGAGDLMFYPGHIGLYLGMGLFVHSVEPGVPVQARHIPERRSLDWGTLAVDG